MYLQVRVYVGCCSRVHKYVTAPSIFGLTALQATQGESWMTAFKHWDVYVDPCYKLYPDVVAKITMETVLAPTM
jgi:hypothetical protein